MFREARDENSIRKPKATLHAMRKNKEYFATKLTKLHKNAGLKFLGSAFYPTDNCGERNKRYHCFPNQADVITRFEDGKPLSCFFLDDDFNKVHVAYNVVGTDCSYASFECLPSSLHTKESGVHFCKFKCIQEHSTAKKNELNITHEALMLPYIVPARHHRVEFQKQFTLIYSDWDVLRCDLEELKGKSCTNNQLFA